MTARRLVLATILALGVPAATPARAAAPDRPVAIATVLQMQDPVAACRRALPAARRFIGQNRQAVQRRFRAPRGVLVRVCDGCTRDLRSNRLTFGLDRTGIVRSVACN